MPHEELPNFEMKLHEVSSALAVSVQYLLLICFQRQVQTQVASFVLHSVTPPRNYNTSWVIFAGQVAREIARCNRVFNNTWFDYNCKRTISNAAEPDSSKQTHISMTLWREQEKFKDFPEKSSTRWILNQTWVSRRCNLFLVNNTILEIDCPINRK